MKSKGHKIAIFGSIFAVILSILIIINVDVYKQTYEREKYNHIASDFDRFCLAIYDFNGGFYEFIEDYPLWRYIKHYNFDNILDAVSYVSKDPEHCSYMTVHIPKGTGHVSEWEDFWNTNIKPALTAIRDFLGTPGREMARIDLASIEYKREPYWQTALLSYLMIEDKLIFNKDELKAQFNTDEDYKTAYIDSLKAAVSEDLPLEEFYRELYYYLRGANESKEGTANED